MSCRAWCASNFDKLPFKHLQQLCLTLTTLGIGLANKTHFCLTLELAAHSIPSAVRSQSSDQVSLYHFVPDTRICS